MPSRTSINDQLLSPEAQLNGGRVTSAMPENIITGERTTIESSDEDQIRRVNIGGCPGLLGPP